MDLGFLWRRKLSVVLIGLLFCLVGTIIFSQGAIQLYRAYRLSGAVPMASGHIDRLYTTTGRKGGIHYRLSYSFAAGGTTVTKQGETIYRGQWLLLNSGQTIQVRYLGDDPTINEPDIPYETGYAIRQGWLSTLFPLLFVGAGIYAAFFSAQGSEPNFYGAPDDRPDRPD